MTEPSKFITNSLLFAVIIALLLQPVGAIDFSNQNTTVLSEEIEISSTGARAAQTEWVTSAVQAAGANTQQPNLVFPSDILVDSNDNVLTVGNLVADITFGTQGASTQYQLGFVALANSQGAWQWVEVLGTYDGGGYAGVTAITQVS